MDASGLPHGFAAETVAWDAPGGSSHFLKLTEHAESSLQVSIRGDLVEILARHCKELHTQRLTGEPDALHEHDLVEFHAAAPLARCVIVAKRRVAP